MTLVTLIQKYKSAEMISDGDMISYVTRVNISRHNIVTCVREIVCHLCFLDNVSVTDRLESFFNMMTSLMSEISFLSDYNELYPIRAEFEHFEKENIMVDTVRKHYILDMFNSTQTSSFMNSHNGAGEKEKTRQVSQHQEDQSSMGACAVVAKPSNMELISLISSVRDLLPHLGEGFVEHVLVEYNYKVDEAINALLENNLPPHLLEMDQSLPRQEVKEEDKSPAPVPRSVYDEDELDVLNRDVVDTSRIRRGKKNKSTDAKKLLEDKSDIWKMKDRFDRLGIVEEIFMFSET